jgi:hypothetical protein
MTQIVEWVNARFAVYSKTGTLLYGPAAGKSVFQGFGGPCATTNAGDGTIEYDKAANRWIISRHAAASSSGPWYQCVAVSKTADATGGYYRYSFQLPNEFPDYPKLGVWPDAYYLSNNELDPNTNAFLYAYGCALQRGNMLSGLAAIAVCFQFPSQYLNPLPSDLDGNIAPPSGSPNYFLNFGSNSLTLWKFHVDFATPSNSTLTGPTNISVAGFSEACGGGICIPQSNTQQKLDSLGDRLMYRLAYRHFSDGHESIVVTHSVGSPSGIRWYEIRGPGSASLVYQQGTFRPDSNYRWMGSIAMDKVGDIAVGYSVSSSSMYPAIRYTGRVPSDPLGTMETEKTIIQGTGSQTNSNRWGDYTSMFVDPTDDCTFWYTNEYLVNNGSNNWHTRIASFKFSLCQ